MANAPSVMSSLRSSLVPACINENLMMASGVMSRPRDSMSGRVFFPELPNNIVAGTATAGPSNLLAQTSLTKTNLVPLDNDTSIPMDMLGDNPTTN